MSEKKAKSVENKIKTRKHLDRITQIWHNIVNKRYRTKEDFIMKRILATFLSAVTLISCSSALAADYSDVNQSAVCKLCK